MRRSRTCTVLTDAVRHLSPDHGTGRHTFKTSHHSLSTNFSPTRTRYGVCSDAAFGLITTLVVRPGKVSRQRFRITKMELR
jgi:hypothetical protein